MSSTITYESNRPHFSEKIENFFRTTENFYVNKSGSGTLSGIDRLGFVRDVYELYVDVPHYKPEEVTVTTQDELLIVSGKHEENRPECGFQSREFTNKYTLPKNIDKSKMTCVFKDKGYLRIQAPYIKPEEPNARTIPIKILNNSGTSHNGTTSKTTSSSSVTTNGTSVSHV